MKREDVAREFLKKNPEYDYSDIEFRFDGRLEWYCECGIGHTVFSPDNNFVHGCCGHCKKVIPLDKTTTAIGEEIENKKIEKKKVYISGKSK